MLCKLCPRNREVSVDLARDARSVKMEYGCFRTAHVAVRPIILTLFWH